MRITAVCRKPAGMNWWALFANVALPYPLTIDSDGGAAWLIIVGITGDIPSNTGAVFDG
jgi:hypothetical protein